MSSYYALDVRTVGISARRAMMRDQPMRDAAMRAALSFTRLIGPSREPRPLNCNPCLGIPPIEIESALRYFGVQMLLGLASSLILVLFG